VARKANLSFKNIFPYISVIDEGSDFKFGMQRGFAKAHHQISPEEKVDVALGYGSSPTFGASALIFLQWLKLATSNLVHSLGLPRPIIQSHSEEKVGVALDHGTEGSSSKFWGSPILFLQRLGLATSISACLP